MAHCFLSKPGAAANVLRLGKQHAYFRGRHLHGTTVPLPDNYTGAVLHVTDKQLPHSQAQRHAQIEEDREDDDEDAAEGEEVEINIAEQIAEFEEVIVWEHGGAVDGEQDMFVRGLTEWVGFAESMHADEEEGAATDTEK